MPKTAVNDIDIYYETRGRGEHLLFISGTGGDLRNKPNIFDSPLVKHFEVLAYDQRGFGQTSKPDIPYSMAGYADDAAGLLDALGWKKCYVIGISFGGMVAQELALRYPQRIKKLVLMCTSSGGAGGRSFPLHELTCLPVEERARKTLATGNLHWGDAWRESHQELYQAALDQKIRQLNFVKSDPELTRGSRRQLEARRQHDTWDRLPQIRIPTGIFGGKHDGIAQPENLQNLHRAIPGSIMEMFEGGHDFHLQDRNAWPRIIKFLKDE
jgi:3-oxoadipate enol-lactonase